MTCQLFWTLELHNTIVKCGEFSDAELVLRNVGGELMRNSELRKEIVRISDRSPFQVMFAVEVAQALHDEMKAETGSVDLEELRKKIITLLQEENFRFLLEKFLSPRQIEIIDVIVAEPKNIIPKFDLERQITNVQEDITEMEHTLEIKKARLKEELLDKESILAERRLKDELARNRMRLAFEKEELEVLKNSPELLMLTPQAARLAEASQNLKNARTVVSFTPQELAQGSELIALFQSLVQKSLATKKED